MAEYIPLITTVGIIASIVFNYISYQRLTRTNEENQGEKNGALSSDIKYIMRRTDDIYLDQKELKRDTSGAIDKINERLTRTEESLKLAHMRIDEVITKDGK